MVTYSFHLTTNVGHKIIDFEWAERLMLGLTSGIKFYATGPWSDLFLHFGFHLVELLQYSKLPATMLAL